MKIECKLAEVIVGCSVYIRILDPLLLGTLGYSSLAEQLNQRRDEESVFLQCDFFIDDLGIPPFIRYVQQLKLLNQLTNVGSNLRFSVAFSCRFHNWYS